MYCIRSSSKVPSVLPLGMSESSLANYRGRLVPQLRTRTDTSTNPLTVPPSQTQPLSDSSSTAAWASLSLLRLPLKLLQQLYYGDSSGGGRGTQASVSQLPCHTYDPVSRQITCHTHSPSSSSELTLSLPTLHALTAPLEERSLCLLHLLLQNRKGGATLSTGNAISGLGTYANPFQQALGLVHDAALETSLREQQEVSDRGDAISGGGAGRLGSELLEGETIVLG